MEPTTAGHAREPPGAVGAGCDAWDDREHVDDHEDNHITSLLLRLGVLRPRSCRAFAGWFDVLEEARARRRAAVRVRALVRRGSAKLAWAGWGGHVDWLAVTRAAACRVSRRQERLGQDAVLHAWRHAVYWRARWRTVAPCITRRWRAAVQRDVTFCWRHTARRLRVLRTATGAFQRRRHIALAADYLHEWSLCAARMSMRVKVMEAAQTRSRTACLRAVFRSWSDLPEQAACRAHAAAVVCRRRDSVLLWDAYHRWSDWSYTSRQHRRAALRVFDRMRVSTAASHKNMLVWKRLSESWADAASEDLKGLGSNLRGHMALALQRGMPRAAIVCARLRLASAPRLLCPVRARARARRCRMTSAYAQASRDASPSSCARCCASGAISEGAPRVCGRLLRARCAVAVPVRAQSSSSCGMHCLIARFPHIVCGCCVRCLLPCGVG